MRAIKWVAAIILGIFVLATASFVGLVGPANVGRAIGLIGGHDKTPPDLPAKLNDRAILVFSKTNGFRDDAQIEAANAALSRVVDSLGGDVYVTENAAVFNPAQLSKFKAVVWNSVSGDVLSTDQRQAFKAYLNEGGGFVGLHGSGGDPSYKWKWYVDELIGAQFIGHTMGPQFPTATIHIEDSNHPATRGLGQTWIRPEEWYSFASSPRAKGYRILATVDEKSYAPEMNLLPFFGPIDLRMGADHPMIWVHCVGNGRAFYSALGHRAESYSEARHLQMIRGAIAWAAGLEGSRCEYGTEVDATAASKHPE